MKLRLPALILPVAIAALLLPSCTTPLKRATTGPLILISIDGFRWDYLQKYDAPVLRQLAAAGVHATRLTPSFPGKTFPNHYTLVTGLRPERHGIVSNYFFDPALNASFNKPSPADNADSRWWARGEPVWITAEKQGVRSACFFWPGSAAENHGLRPSYYRIYKDKIDARENVDDLLRQISRPAEERPRFHALYFDVVDVRGHKFGPDAPETGAAVQEVDAAVTRLLEGLARLGLRDSTNLVFVSDHGMTPVSSERVIFLEDLMALSTVRVESYGPNGGVRPLSGSAAELVAQIRAKNIPHLQVYLREEVPARFHFRDNPRIPPVVLMADPGWSIEPKTNWPNRLLTYERGTHGYDPALPDMGGLFLAHGPAFRRGVEIPDMEDIHVYNLLCATLGVKPAANDGDQRLVRAALRR